jgi:hypothetical protein
MINHGQIDPVICAMLCRLLNKLQQRHVVTPLFSDTKNCILKRAFKTLLWKFYHMNLVTPYFTLERVIKYKPLNENCGTGSKDRSMYRTDIYKTGQRVWRTHSCRSLFYLTNWWPGSSQLFWLNYLCVIWIELTCPTVLCFPPPPTQGVFFFKNK